MTINAGGSEQLNTLVDEFRSHMETFYAGLKLAPPYHTVEKAVGHLSQTVKAMTPEQRAQLVTDVAARWEVYTAAFAASGLAHKHRGIIAEMVRSHRAQLPAQYQRWLNLYGAGASRSS